MKLSQREIAELEAKLRSDIRVGLLFVGQLDVAADGEAVGLHGAAVGRFHDSRAAAGHDRVPFACQ